MYTKTWRVNAPSLSKRTRSIYGDWTGSIIGDETPRIFEVFCADVTGHPSYLLVRITRETERDCDREFNGQLTDGFFEDYRGNIDAVVVSNIMPAPKQATLEKFVAEQMAMDFNIDTYKACESIEALAAALSYVGLDGKSVGHAYWKAKVLKRALEQEKTPKAESEFYEAYRNLLAEREKAFEKLSEVASKLSTRKNAA